MKENYKRAKEKRRKVLRTAKDEAVREWQFTKNRYDAQKVEFDKVVHIWQVANERVLVSTRSLEEAKSENEKLKSFFGIVERPSTPPITSPPPPPSTPPSSSTPSPSFSSSPQTASQSNSSSSPSPRPRQSTSSTPPSPRRERGANDSVRPALTTSFNSPPSRPLSTSFANGSPIRPKMVRRSSDPPPKHPYFVPPQQQQEQLQHQQQQHQQQLPSVPEQLEPQQQERKLQVHEQLLQQIQSQLHQKFPSQPVTSIPSSAIPVLPPPPSPSPAQSIAKSPVTSHRFSVNPSPQLHQTASQSKKSLPPLPLHIITQQSQTESKNEDHQEHKQQETEKQRVILNLQELERKHLLPRSHSDDQTKSKSKVIKSHGDLSHSLPILPDFVDTPTLSSTPAPSSLSSFSSLSSSTSFQKPLQSETSSNFIYSALKPDEIALLDEAQALVDYLEAEVELNVSFEYLWFFVLFFPLTEGINSKCRKQIKKRDEEKYRSI